MSLRSMADMRADVEAQGASDDQRKLVDQLIALVPTEAVGLYIATIGAAVFGPEWVRWLCLGAVTVLTPCWVLYSYWKAKAENVGFPKFEMAVGTAAFLAWSTSVPKGPWDDVGLPTWVGTLIVVFSSALLLLVTNLEALWRKHAKPPPSDP